MAEASSDCLLQEDVTKPEAEDIKSKNANCDNQETELATPAESEPVPVLDLKEEPDDANDKSLPAEEPILEKPDGHAASSVDVRPDSALSDRSTFSEGSTPHDGDTSSGSPSPIPDDSPEGSGRPKVRLGRDISLMMQALNSLHSPEEKIAALCKKYADLLEQQKMKEKQLRVAQRKHLQYVKDREQLQTDLNKALFGKSKMESLARELNKDNKRLKEQLYNDAIRMDKEKERVSAKFLAATDEISGKINSISDQNAVLHEENKSLAAKIQRHVEETTSREKTIKALLEHRDLKEQILTLELKKAEEDRSLSLTRQKELLEDAEKSRALCEAFVKQEKEMKSQIEYYSEKFEDFQSTLDKSNQIFASFRTEMDRMTKRIKDLEKGTAMWKKKWEDNEAIVTRVVGEKVEQDRFVDQLKEKLARLTTLCRALQGERNELSKKLTRFEKKDKAVLEVKPKSNDKSKKATNQNSSDSRTVNSLSSHEPETSLPEPSNLPLSEAEDVVTVDERLPDVSQSDIYPAPSEPAQESNIKNEATSTNEESTKISQINDEDQPSQSEASASGVPQESPNEVQPADAPLLSSGSDTPTAAIPESVATNLPKSHCVAEQEPSEISGEEAGMSMDSTA